MSKAKTESKLFQLKEWLTMEEAASHISSVLGEPATVADLYRFALDGHLTMSVDFVNHAQAKKGKWLKAEQVKFDLIEYNIFTEEKLEMPHLFPSNGELRVSEEDWIALEKSVVSISGVWDLPMVGAERLDIEHEYQQLTSGLEVTLVVIGGVFVQKGDVICQLQTGFDDSDHQKVSKARQKNMEHYIATNDVSKDEAKKLRVEFKIDRDKDLEKRKDNPKEENYFPAGGLAESDYALVVRTQEITRFIQSLEGASNFEKPLTTNERNTLLVIIAALCKEAEVDYKKKGIAVAIEKMTEDIDALITGETILKVLKKIDGAVKSRSK